VEGLFLEALALLEDVVPSPELVRVLIEWGRYGANRSDMAPASAAFGRAVDVARQIDAPEPALALNLRACVLANQGSAECLTDFRRSLELARQQGLGVDRGRAWYNYAAFLCQIEGPSRSLEEYEEAMTFASSRGLTSLLTLNIVGRVESLAYAGRWAEAVAVADAVLASADPGSLSHLLLLRQVRLLVLTWQGRLEGATEELDSVLADCLDSPLGGDAALGLLCAAMAASRFDPGRADALLERMLPSSSRGEANWFGLLMAEAGRVAARGATAGLTERLLRCLGGTLPAVVLARDSFAPLIAERRGDHEVAAAGFAAAAAAWHDFGAPYEEGQALLGRGRCLAALGWEPEATSALAAAGEIFARLGAAPALEEAQAVLASMSSP